MLIGASAAMRQVLEQVRRAVLEPINVLVCGEPGSGRQFVARRIHSESRRADRQFVEVDCHNFIGTDAEVALFGRRHGPGNGNGEERRALERLSRKSPVSESNGGTLFLQNVPDLPARAQSRLARALRDGEVSIVEDEKAVDIDLRVIASVERGLAGNGDGGIHPELFKRLAVLRVDLPALRERREDIPELASHLVAVLCARSNVACKELSESAKSMLAALPWRRANGTELRSLLEALVFRVAGPMIGLDEVLAHVQLDAHAAWFPVGFSLRDARARFEREYIAAVLEQHRGRIPDAAQTLGIQRSNLYRKMRRLNVPPKRH